MQMFFKTPFLFWYGFVFSFLICTGMMALMQCWFLINFCDVKSKKRYYFIYLIISYAQYMLGLSSNMQPAPMLDTLVGAVILFVFINKLLRQNVVTSAIAATLTMSVVAIGESMSFFAEYVTTVFMPLPAHIGMVGNILIISLVSFFIFQFFIFRFFICRYSIKSQCKSKYFFAFSLPIFFISIVLRMVNYIRYNPTSEGILLQSDRIQNYEVLILTVTAFLCICTVLFTYEKTMKQMESENERTLLCAQISAQENYVAEAKQKYEATKAFRHDFNNHILALKGLIDRGDIGKAAAYLERFDQINREITFSVRTGNGVVDTLLGEKLSYASQIGIHTQCDVTVPATVKIDDFDLCAIFANAIDNAIRACSSIESGEKMIDVVAKPNKNFFVIDMINSYQAGKVPKGSGMGLPTINIIAEKYQGAVEIFDEDGIFRISVILPFGGSC